MRLLHVSTALLLSLSLPSLALAQYPVIAAAPADDELSEEEKVEKAKKLYVQAEGLAADENWEAAVVLYEQAYYLVPGKHGFAHKVGIAAWKIHNCDKAYEYMTHFVEYGDPEKQGEKMTQAKDILAEIEAENCRTPEAEPEPEPEPEPVQDVENPFAEGVGETPPDGSKGKKDKEGGKGLLIGGAVLLTLGVGGLGAGAAGTAIAIGAGTTLDDLASTSTMTGYPVGDYACRDEGAECPVTLEGQLATGKLLTYVGFIGGGVLVVAGATLIALHVVKNKKKAGASAKAKPAVELTGLGPTLMPGAGGGAMASLRF